MNHHQWTLLPCRPIACLPPAPMPYLLPWQHTGFHLPNPLQSCLRLLPPTAPSTGVQGLQKQERPRAAEKGRVASCWKVEEGGREGGWRLKSLIWKIAFPLQVLSSRASATLVCSLTPLHNYHRIKESQWWLTPSIPPTPAPVQGAPMLLLTLPLWPPTL